AAGWGVPALASGITVMQGVMIEALITFFLVFSVFMTAANEKIASRIGGLGVGLTLVVLALFAGPFTGAAANPAVFMGPAIASGNFTNWYVYVIGDVAGGIIAALVCGYGLLRKGR
ncbi:aquaporin, partial [Candidatus Marsarchaeota archaeon]|nr:aquaporin [Candidatus Marsarchaeota archaeon]